MLWLSPLAFPPQLVLLYWPAAGGSVDEFSAACLPASLSLFLGFAWLNRRLRGMKILLAGLALNLMVRRLYAD